LGNEVLDARVVDISRCSVVGVAYYRTGCVLAVRRGLVMREKEVDDCISITCLCMAVSMFLGAALVDSCSMKDETIWKQAVERGYAEEVETSSGKSYLWKEQVDEQAFGR
jgi:hypothetical protein